MKYIFFAILIVGCSTVQLSPAAKQVSVVYDLKYEDTKKLEEVGHVEADGFSEESNRNELRNKAAQLGASVVVVESRSSYGSAVYWKGTAYKEKK